MEGWIKVHRSIMENWLWQERTYSRLQAWLEIIMLANHTGKKARLGNEFVYVERGSLITSELKLSARWGWSKTKVRAFLTMLENDKMIEKKTDRKKTTITIVNYGIYQEPQTTEELQKDYEKTTKEPQKNTNKNEKNDKNEKNEDIIVEQTASEYQYKDVVDYLNLVSGKLYKDKSKDTRKHIKARFDDGFSLDDFKRVIDVKCTEWTGTDMAKFIRPSTLFGTKFESYLNQSPTKREDDGKSEWEEFLNE